MRSVASTDTDVVCRKMDEIGWLNQSHLFTVRLWREDLGAGQSEWRGRVEHVLSGQRRYFREWPVLISFLAAKLQELEDRDLL